MDPSSSVSPSTLSYSDYISGGRRRRGSRRGSRRGGTCPIQGGRSRRRRVGGRSRRRINGRSRRRHRNTM